MKDSALSLKFEMDTFSANVRVLTFQSRKSEGLIGPCVLFVSNPNERAIEQLDDTSDDLRLRKLALSHVETGSPTNRGKDPTKLKKLGKFSSVATFAPFCVIPILLSSARVEGRGLEMAFRIGIYPDALISGWNGEFPNAFQNGYVPNFFPLRVDIIPLPHTSVALDAGFLVGGVGQPGISGNSPHFGVVGIEHSFSECKSRTGFATRKRGEDALGFTQNESFRRRGSASCKRRMDG